MKFTKSTIGKIYIDKSILDHELYNYGASFILFIHILLTAAETKTGKLKKGQVITSRNKLAEETGLSEQQIRTALSKIAATNLITIVATNQHTIITVKSYGAYISINKK